MKKAKYNLTPILKWVGGKRQLLNEIIPLIPEKINTYVEPFLGGGAVLFFVQPKKAIVNDLNKELINVYNTIKNNPKELISKLRELKSLNSEKYFYDLRSLDRNNDFHQLDNVFRAARIIYLNKTCYNGLFRVNKAGQFNTPYGRYKKPNIFDLNNILEMSRYFNDNNIQIINKSYEEVLKNLKKGDFVYLDPPYMPLSSSSSFTGYTQSGFDENQQIKLKQICDALNKKGVKFLLSNSDHPFIKDLYKNYTITIIKAKRVINSKSDKRGEINEILVRNY
ncbi:DNA adenine methylase [Mycoplasma leachii]|uniref:Site-specific DNA-methyltransferase (adenine-specific) n=1 Tax=Mycoplasma leachii 06049 TaxID=1188244 RepID=A0A2T4I9P2_9MOLU|nr:DNA adenine methylase [Mycoplasma leachii]PTD31238.1 Type II restriction modification system adenine-specific DNA methyltransferase (M) subunit [Mycoplasma leachii 06049]